MKANHHPCFNITPHSLRFHLNQIRYPSEIEVMPIATRSGRIVTPVKKFEDEEFTPGSGSKDCDHYDRSYFGNNDVTDCFIDDDDDESTEMDDFIVNDDDSDDDSDDEWCE